MSKQRFVNTSSREANHARNFKYTNPALKPNQSFPFSNDGTWDDSTDHFSVDHLDLSRLEPAAQAVGEISSSVQQTLVLYVKTQKLAQYENKPLGFINHTFWIPQDEPLLSLPKADWDDHQFVPFIKERTWIDLVINNLDDGSHPFHLHGHEFYVLSSYRADGRTGWGSYNPFEGSEPPSGLDLASPLRKDTVAVPRRGHVVLRIAADNPGIWMLHCHVQVHMSTGMAMAIHVGENEEHVDTHDSNM